MFHGHHMMPSLESERLEPQVLLATLSVNYQTPTTFVNVYFIAPSIDMSHIASALPQPASRKASHSRHPSSSSLQHNDARSSVQPPASTAGGRPQVHYTCLIRLPFARGDFVDPPIVDWDAAKDKALWKIISKTSNSKDLNWDELAVRFDVGLPFLLQQAAWLYERHFASMKEQLQKIGSSAIGSGMTSPVPPASTAEDGGDDSGLKAQARGWC